MAEGHSQIPIAVKLAYTAFVAVLVPVYGHAYGPQNFLWFSDIAVLMLAVGLWRESALITSMSALMVLVFELGWNAAFFTGGQLHSGVDYMFDPALPLHLRGLSLFHVFLPLTQIWMLHRLGYDRRALSYQTIILWPILIASYLLSPPSENINYVFGFGGLQTSPPTLLHLLFLAVAIPVLIYLPTHFVLKTLFAPRRRGEAAGQTSAPG